MAPVAMQSSIVGQAVGISSLQVPLLPASVRSSDRASFDVDRHCRPISIHRPTQQLLRCTRQHLCALLHCLLTCETACYAQVPRIQLLQPARPARRFRQAAGCIRAAAVPEGMDQSKTSDRGQGDGGPDIISGAVSKGLQGIREVGKQARATLSDMLLAEERLQWGSSSMPMSVLSL